MARGNQWWNEPPLWAWIVMVVGAVAFAVMLPFALNRSAPASVGEPLPTTAAPGSSEPSPSPPAQSTPAETTPPAEAEPEPEQRVVVIGDGYTSGTAQGGVGPQSWPALLDERLEDATVEAVADVGSGYVATGAGGQTLTDLAAAADLEGADVVVVFGSRDDAGGVADQVAEAAGDLLADVAAQAPEAELVVIGPAWPESPAPAGVRDNRDVIRGAAGSTAAAWVDPLFLEWFVRQPDLLGEDGVYPTDEGHVFLADEIEPFVRAALGE